LLLADEAGRIYDHPGLLLAGQSWDRTRPPAGRRDTIPLPAGTELAFLPGRRPVGLDPDSGAVVCVERFEVDGRTFQPLAVAAIPPPGHLRHLLPAARMDPAAPPLPLRSYCAVGIVGDGLRLAASRIDPRTHWDPERFTDPALEAGLAALVERFAHNRVLRQLVHCVRDYGCCTASNVFLGAYEGALPVAPRCNAHCLGCISAQAGPAPSPQQRLAAPPPVDDIVELGAHHLAHARSPMVSFGQGCEGEPLTQAETITAAIRGIRRRTGRGAVHMNTNGSRPEVLDALADAGLGSVRVSLISARPELFAAYHRAEFGLDAVERFITRAVERGLFVALNLLLVPGLTDRPAEIDALVALLGRSGAHMVQLRNLDLDPQRLFAELRPAAGEPVGMRALVHRLQRRVPGLELGSFNRLPGDRGPGFDRPQS
jgi:pyruvate-formate lyase-activating enzyme